MLSPSECFDIAPHCHYGYMAIIVSAESRIGYLLVILDYHQAQCVNIQSIVFRLKPWKWGLPGMVNYNYNTIAPPTHTYGAQNNDLFPHNKCVEHYQVVPS